ncbi:MAG: DUF503 domain-containing protein [bacterium]
MAAIGLLEVEFLIPAATSLKDKRRVVKSLKDRVRNSYNVSIAEVEYADVPGRCHLAVVTICEARSEAQHRLESVERLILAETVIAVTDRQLTWL